MKSARITASVSKGISPQWRDSYGLKESPNMIEISLVTVLD